MSTVLQTLEQSAGEKLTVGKAINTVRGVIEANAAAMFAALPKHITPERFTRVALSAIRMNPQLLQCTPGSFYGALTEAATAGLEIGTGAMAQAYLVPYKEECVLIPGYRGLLSLAYRSGEIASVTCESVYRGDEFEYELGDNPHIKHVPSDENDRIDPLEITHVYAVFNLKTGGVARTVWPRKKIDAHGKRYSPAYAKGKKDCVWITNWEVAAKKTVLRDIINRGLVPVSVELQGLSVQDEYRETMNGEVVPVRLPAESLAALTERLKTGHDAAPADATVDAGTPPEGPQTAPTATETDVRRVVTTADPHEAAGNAAAEHIGDQTPQPGQEVNGIALAESEFAEMSDPAAIDRRCKDLQTLFPDVSTGIAFAANARKTELSKADEPKPVSMDVVFAKAQDDFRAATSLKACGTLYRSYSEKMPTSADKDKLHAISQARQDEIRGSRGGKSNE